MDGPDDCEQVKCECGCGRFYWQIEIYIDSAGSRCGKTDQLFECVKCGNIYNGWGEKQNT